ncbi:MAG: LicD family protein [Lachnospiraceae bacterium]|nr:LicD family protein [Aeriscardovia sp.]MBR2755770.1 LicD family protein [Lachnospiraceae bacterium]MBR3309474.1 LicD family protein [Lachnospiraceae bacterium]
MELRQLQLVELDMLKQFVAFCEKNGLRYYLLEGTLLGAVRHKGFIPWDDDIDVVMPRNDYNKLLELGRNAFEEPLSLNHYSFTPGYYYSFARLANNSIHIMNHSANIPRKEAVAVDIIPLDGFPDPGIRRLFHKLRITYWWDLNNLAQFDELVDQKRKRTRRVKFFLAIASKLQWLFRNVNTKKCLENVNKALAAYDYDSDTNYVINYLGTWGFHEIIPRDYMGEGSKVEFEGEEFMAPADTHAMLTMIYGDYMTMPPENERNWHNAEIIEE